MMPWIDIMPIDHHSEFSLVLFADIVHYLPPKIYINKKSSNHKHASEAVTCVVSFSATLFPKPLINFLLIIEGQMAFAWQWIWLIVLVIYIVVIPVIIGGKPFIPVLNIP